MLLQDFEKSYFLLALACFVLHNIGIGKLVSINLKLDLTYNQNDNIRKSLEELRRIMKWCLASVM